MPGSPKRKSDTQRLENEIGEGRLTELIEQGLTMRKCAEALGVGPLTLSRWVSADPARAEKISRARASAAHALADQALDISDESTPETERIDRLRIETRRWLAGKWNPESFADRSGPQVTVNITQQHLGSLRDLLSAHPQQGAIEAVETDVKQLR
jgi:transcriptional regulator with XRE-family HTH domain